MPPLLLYTYYYKYKDERKVIKNLVESDNVEVASIQINDVITEHDTYVNERGIQNDGNNFTSIDNLKLHHAKLHLDSLVDTQQLHQKTLATRALEED